MTVSESEKVLDTAEFRVTGKDCMGKERDFTIKAFLMESGAFAYGNGTCTVLEWGGGREDCYDTRYVNVRPFDKFAKGLIEDNVAKTMKVEKV